jgi:hypothetical protein
MNAERVTLRYAAVTSLKVSFLNCVTPFHIFSAVKRQGREADRSPPSSAEVKNDGSIPPLPHTSSWYTDYLIKHRGNFTFSVTLFPSSVA